MPRQPPLEIRTTMISLAANPVVDLEVDLIDPSPLNPRKDFDGLDDLAASLMRGQLEAIIVRPHPSKPGRFELANGERRWRAARSVKKETLEAKVRELSDAQMLDIMLGSGAAGNVCGLNPLEEAAGYATALEVMRRDDGGRFSQVELALHFGRTRDYVRDRIVLLKLNDRAKGAVLDGSLPAQTAKLIANIPEAAAQLAATEDILSDVYGGNAMPYRTAEKHIREKYSRPLRSATFDLNDAELVPAAGACTGCEHNSATHLGAKEAANSRCTNVECFARKMAAYASRLLATEQAAGKSPLPPEINAVVFPADGKGLAWNSGHVEFSKRPPEDLLKTEVQKAPTWRELCGDRVTVHVGIDQDGKVVDVVKLEDALTAVPEDEVAIFKDEVVRKHGLKMRATAAPGAPRGASVVETERNDIALREKAERAAKKRDKKSRAWLDDLVTGLEGMAAAGKPVWVSYTFWSLMFDRMLAALGDDDVIFVCELYGIEGNIDDETTARKALTDFVGTISRERCGALVTAMTLAPWLRAEGPDAAFVAEWHEAFVSGAESEPVRQAQGDSVLTESESKRLAELVKAYAGGEGMSPQRCAEEFKMTLEDVCGALQLDIVTVRNVVTQLRLDVEEAFTAANLAKPEPMNRITKTATGSRVKNFADLARPEDFRRLLSMLSQKMPKPAAKDEDYNEVTNSGA